MELKQFSFFKNLKEADLWLISNKLIEKSFEKGNVFISQGDTDDSVYFITDGHVSIYKLTDEGKRISLAVEGPGEAIGEMAPIFGGVRTAYCEAQSEVKTLVLQGAEFRDLLTENPKLSFAFLQIYCERLSQANKRIEELISFNLKEKTHSLLKTLASFSDSGVVNASHEEIASILAATRPRVSEAIQELVSEKKLVIKDKSIYVK